MDRAELRRELEWFCGCGNPDDASATLLRLLRLCPLFEHRDEFEALIPDSGLQYLTLYWLTHLDWLEHGGSVGGSWLTPKGEAVRNALTREEADSFEALHEAHCIHGYDVDDDSHDCMAVEDAR